MNPIWEKFFTTICRFLAVNKLTTTACNPETNGHVYCYHCIKVARLIHYVSKYQRDWDTCLLPLTCAYNIHTHWATGNSWFVNVMPRESLPVTELGCSTGTASNVPRHPQSPHMNQRLHEGVALVKQLEDAWQWHRKDIRTITATRLSGSHWYVLAGKPISTATKYLICVRSKQSVCSKRVYQTHATYMRIIRRNTSSVADIRHWQRWHAKQSYNRQRDCSPETP